MQFKSKIGKEYQESNSHYLKSVRSFFSDQFMIFFKIKHKND